MPLYTTPDGRYTYAIETPGSKQDGNSVIYDRDAPGGTPPYGKAIWDRLSYEAAHRAPAAVWEPPPEPARPPSTSPAGGGRLVKVTDASDGELVNRGNSNYPQAWLNGTSAYVFCGAADDVPRFFRIDLETDRVTREPWRLLARGTTDGWYWDAEGFIYLLDGPRLQRADPFGATERVVFDISDTHPGHRLWQAHSSSDGQTHSATVQRIVEDGPYPNIGTVVFWQGEQQFFPAHGTLDESQITSDGAYLIIKEDDDNRIITMGTRETRLLKDADGAIGHSDVGPGFVVGEDNIHGACVLWDLRKPLTPGNRRELFSTWGMGHLSVRGGRCLLSDAVYLKLVDLERGGVSVLHEHGMVGTDYDHQVMANLDHTGRVAAYLSNTAGRLDLYLLL